MTTSTARRPPYRRFHVRLAGFVLMVLLPLLLPPTGMARDGEDRALLVSRGTAVIGESIAAAREEAIRDALERALETYIFARLGAGQGQEELVRDTILQRRERYILSYELQSSRMLGEMYQVEVNAYLHAGLLQADLTDILTPTRQAVNRIDLVLDAMSASGPSAAAHSAPERLVANLARELAAYGFTPRIVSGAPAAAVRARFRRLTEDAGTEAAATPDMPLPELEDGDAELVVLIAADPVREGVIATVDKTVLTGGFELFFADCVNRLANRFADHDVRVVAGDPAGGRERLDERLAEMLNNMVMEYLLREYAVFPAHSRELIVSLRGIRHFADLRQLRSALEALRTVESSAIDRLAAGQVDLRVRTFASGEMLVDWFGGYRFADGRRCRAILEPPAGERILVDLRDESAASP
ncbi:MAG: hypothetical protein JW781_10655 [Deltaproteobacteria bacterium]|nr:hypothetical protein [Candidatus Anaeroferrophillacea bacterium]